jgi:hypothetical protein
VLGGGGLGTASEGGPTDTVLWGAALEGVPQGTETRDVVAHVHLGETLPRVSRRTRSQRPRTPGEVTAPLGLTRAIRPAPTCKKQASVT